MNPFNISFLIPGYLPPFSSIEPESAELGSAAAVAMRWESGLVQQPWQANFEQILGLKEPSALHLPTARLTCGEHTGLSALVRADPIHLQADRDTAKLLPAEMLALREGEVTGLLKDLNVFLISDNLVLSRTEDHAWHLSGMDASQLASYPPSFLANRNASAYLPTGEGSGSWRRLMTEVQMLLHAHPINEQRERQGKLPINSLWFWGGAALYSNSDRSIEHLKYTGTVYADDEFSRAVCADLQVSCEPLAAFDPYRSAESVVIDTRIASAIFARDESEMHQAIAQIDQQWLAPLRQRINQGEISQLTIMNEDGDKGVLTKEWLKAQSRSESRLLQVLEMIKFPRIVKQWLSAMRQS